MEELQSQPGGWKPDNADEWVVVGIAHLQGGTF